MFDSYDELSRFVFEDAKTFCEACQRGCRMSKNGPMLGYRKKQADGSEPYVWLSYKEVKELSIFYSEFSGFDTCSDFLNTNIFNAFIFETFKKPSLIVFCKLLFTIIHCFINIRSLIAHTTSFLAW